MLDGFAVDLGGSKIAAARITGGRLAARQQIATDGDGDWQDQVAAMAALLDDLGFRSGDPLGVAVAGRVDRQGGWHAVNTGTLRAIAAAPLGPELALFFGPRARAINDAAAAALAEARVGAGQGADNFAFLTVSTGVGGGIVLGGRLVDSASGLAGHVGFVGSRLGDGRCGSGRIGTVESVAAGRAIAAAAGVSDAREAFADPGHTPIIDRSAAAVAALIADLTTILGLDRVAIGGGIGLADGYLDRVARHLSGEPPLFRPDLVRAALGHDAGLIGALIHASEAP
ncbi:ROK family protein [Paracoccus sp. p4-l81]|uniref:ROK family protein n=1 Tax=unclassified Paracoccus (in: a-proteobacteria) TaxID=2688777 RepID=UPI0035B92760